MESKRYNGWTNYETWNAALWLDNDQGMQELMREWAQAAYDRAEDGETYRRQEEAALELMETIKELFENDAAEGPVYGWKADAVNAYLSEINWYEIAEHYISEVDTEATA